MECPLNKLCLATFRLPRKVPWQQRPAAGKKAAVQEQGRIRGHDGHDHDDHDDHEVTMSELSETSTFAQVARS